MGRTMIAMSGGVDSSAAALLMLRQGETCAGATLQMFRNDLLPPDAVSGCCSEDDAQDAKAVAARLGIPHYTFDMSPVFLDEVVTPFIRAYEQAETPNPCIRCNRHLKFGALLDKALMLGYDTLATGHYVRREYSEAAGRFLLKKALDPSKDQSYVLYCLTQEQLARAAFPLGALTKQEVRRLAAENGFVTASKGESQDICFIQNESYADFIARRTGKEYPPGEFVDEDGRVLGTHRGIVRYTVGQRRGLGIAYSEPLYVKAVLPAENKVVLAPDRSLYTDRLRVRALNLIDRAEIREPTRLKVKIRYRHTEQWACVTQTDDDAAEVVFDEPQRAVTPGQSAVFYDGDTVVGGGEIE